jgi:hypothetical protein
MFIAHGRSCVYKSCLTLRNHIYNDFSLRRAKLILELDANCVSISFTLDLWTSLNQVPIFAIIGHWYTKDFQEREEVLEFIEVKGSHTGEQLAEHVEKLLEELKIKHKLFAITRDNASNNGTLCQSLFDSLKRQYDDKPTIIGRPRMRFHSCASWIRCLAHIVSLICTDVLYDLKAKSAKEAKKALDSWDKQFECNTYTIPDEGGRSAIAKVQLLNLWMLQSTLREQDWKEMPKAALRRPIYDVDTRWNSAYNMIRQYLDLEAEYAAFIESHPQVQCLLLSNKEVISLHQLAFVLKPFKDHTLKVLEDMPSLVRSLKIY